jgi:hypothetical protein
VNERYREGLREQFAKVCARHGLPFGRYYETAEDENGESEDVQASVAEPVRAPASDAQIALALMDEVAHRTAAATPHHPLDGEHQDAPSRRTRRLGTTRG